MAKPPMPSKQAPAMPGRKPPEPQPPPRGVATPPRTGGRGK